MNIQAYNDMVTEIVYDFAKRYYREVYEEEMDQSDWKHYIDIHEYKGILQGPIELGGNYFALEDIVISETHQIPCKVYEEWYDTMIDTDCKLGYNLYNYWKKETNPNAYAKEQAKSLKRSKKSVKKAKEYFEKSIKKYKE